MGLFDTFIIEGNCWNCGAILNDWQTKAIGQNMDVFRKGDVMILFDLSISEGTVKVYTNCSEGNGKGKGDSFCGKWNDGEVYIVTGIVSKIKVLKP